MLFVLLDLMIWGNWLSTLFNSFIFFNRSIRVSDSLYCSYYHLSIYEFTLLLGWASDWVFLIFFRLFILAWLLVETSLLLIKTLTKIIVRPLLLGIPLRSKIVLIEKSRRRLDGLIKLVLIIDIVWNVSWIVSFLWITLPFL